MSFPLFDKASQAGVLDTGNALIVAPTATGKSYIGRRILRSAVERRERGVQVYLVPYRALATEMDHSFKKELEKSGIEATVRVATGDYSDPVYPQETDILISTYERFGALLRLPDLKLGRVVIDEVHLIADPTRGPHLEGLIARLKFGKPPESLCALSAVVSNSQELADWLNVPLIVGDASDRAVKVELGCDVTASIDDKLQIVLREVLTQGEQAIVFCRSKAATQKLTRDLRPVFAEYLSEHGVAALKQIAREMAEDPEEAEDLLELLPGGIAFHHAGLSRDSRRAVETAFREGHLKAIACTPTLAAGVNLPAGLVAVRDVFRTEFIRGYPKRVLLSTGELLNMLGRAGRPGQVEKGRGLALIEEDALSPEEIEDLQSAIQAGKGNPVTSRLPDSFDALMRLLLAVIADRGEVTLADLRRALRETLWYHENPSEIEFDRPFQEDIMEDIPAFARVDSNITLEEAHAVADGVDGVIHSSKRYNFSLRFSGLDCTCPARSKWRRRDVCKHLAFVIDYLLFESGVAPELRNRAIYAAAHYFRKTLDLGTKIQEAVKLLHVWNLIESIPAGYRVTPVGGLAANSSLDLLLMRTAQDRIREFHGAPDIKDIAEWVISDYFADENKRNKWLKAIVPWIQGGNIKKISLPEKYRGNFERELENLGQLAVLYGEIARSLGKQKIAEICRKARGCIQYGVSPELIPLISLRIPGLGRARCRFLYRERNIRSLEELAHARPEELTGPTCPHRLTWQWVQRAQTMWKSRHKVLRAPMEKRDKEIDDFLARFRMDQLSLFGKHGVLDQGTPPTRAPSVEPQPPKQVDAAHKQIREEIAPESGRIAESESDRPIRALLLIIAPNREACGNIFKAVFGGRAGPFSYSKLQMSCIYCGRLKFKNDMTINLLGLPAGQNLACALKALATKTNGFSLVVDLNESSSWGYAKYLLKELRNLFGTPYFLTALGNGQQTDHLIPELKRALSLQDSERLFVLNDFQPASVKNMINQFCSLIG
ncbi:DEAD/DEAH box helicase [candidate division KSB1 bacterium]|nr:DEAD/DEAH box helicase [candidate division KSB1 bacterium]NIV69019.1 DEAD/DEAH box helicase [Phycisphaerae bacterium]NIR69018.1 DEAD/DEAH box helicase [candidate division KSB1 bacterium]NIS24090.1 DEAD/DEAH box helicase [candidate division KSB1 bacterium]NIT71009.1 DEAD/DEAH box helicase [candidate division KSB1 bacterium]